MLRVLFLLCGAYVLGGPECDTVRPLMVDASVRGFRHDIDRFFRIVDRKAEDVAGRNPFTRVTEALNRVSGNL
jgi:hypothetical protein